MVPAAPLLFAAFSLLRPAPECLGLPQETPLADGQGSRKAIAEAPIFALRRGPAGIALEALEVQEGTPLKLPLGTGEGWLGVILPPGPGGSASILKPGQGGADQVTLRDGKLGVTHVSERGTWQGPAHSVESLRGLRVRVCVTASDGTAAAFVIKGWQNASQEKIGPVVDFFAGRVPLGDGDYALSTDTIRLRTGPSVSGSCPLVLDRYLFAKGEVAGGGRGWFVVDTGGGTTAVVRSVLPEGCSVERAQAVQYTSGKREFVKYSPHGATGAISAVVGAATLNLVLGDLSFEDARVVVFSKLPDLFGRPVVGILGLDLLRRAARCRFDFGKDGGKLVLSEERGEKDHSAGLPFTYVKSHLMVSVLVNGTRISTIVDTGSPSLLLDTTAANAAGIDSAGDTERKARGIDTANKVAVHDASGALSVGLGQAVVKDPKTVVGALPAFATLRGRNQRVGLLGNTVLTRFSAMELDFRSERLLLFR